MCLQFFVPQAQKRYSKFLQKYFYINLFLKLIRDLGNFYKVILSVNSNKTHENISLDIRQKQKVNKINYTTTTTTTAAKAVTRQFLAVRIFYAFHSIFCVTGSHEYYCLGSNCLKY